MGVGGWQLFVIHTRGGNIRDKFNEGQSLACKDLVVQGCNNKVLTRIFTRMQSCIFLLNVIMIVICVVIVVVPDSDLVPPYFIGLDNHKSSVLIIKANQVDLG